jgi:hypothetical protein
MKKPYLYPRESEHSYDLTRERRRRTKGLTSVLVAAISKGFLKKFEF